MTPHQISLIKTSWEKLKKINSVLVGDVFFSKLFLEAPEVQSLFRSSRIEQANKLITTLAVIVAQLEQLDKLTHAIEQLAIRHVSYGVKPQHYKLVGIALLWSLEHLLNENWNEELREAWNRCYDLLPQSMIHATYNSIAVAE
jgi:hemoglobin-like flavoprotein